MTQIFFVFLFLFGKMTKIWIRSNFCQKEQHQKVDLKNGHFDKQKNESHQLKKYSIN